MKKALVLLVSLICFLILSCAGVPKSSDKDSRYYELTSSVEDLAYQLVDTYRATYNARSVDNPPIRRLAILDSVNIDGKKTTMGREIASTLQSIMFSPNLFTLLERARIADLLAEYTLSQSGIVEELTTTELGKLLGAEIVIVTSYSIEVDEQWNASEYRIGSRIVDLETGEVLGVGRVVYVVDGIVTE